MKGLSLSIQRKLVERNRLFYGQWRYCVTHRLEEAHCVRKLDPASIDQRIDRTNYYRKKYHEFAPGGPDMVTLEQIDNLHEFAGVLMSASEKFQMFIEYRKFRVYTNDLTLVDRLNHMSFVTDSVVTESIPTVPEGSILLKRSNYTYRTYLRNREVTTDEKETFVRFLRDQSTDIKLSPRLFSWTHFVSHSWTYSTHFIDHGDESMIVALEMVLPGVTGKTVNIVRDK